MELKQREKWQPCLFRFNRITNI